MSPFAKPTLPPRNKLRRRLARHATLRPHEPALRSPRSSLPNSPSAAPNPRQIGELPESVEAGSNAAKGAPAAPDSAAAGTRAAIAASDNNVASTELGGLLRSALADYANARASFLQNKLAEIGRRRTTIAVGVVEDEQGARRVIIGQSEPRVRKSYVRPQVEPFVRPTEEIVPGTGHAEMDILNYAEANDLKVIAVGAGNGYCPACVKAIEDAGGLATGRRKK